MPKYNPMSKRFSKEEIDWLASLIHEAYHNIHNEDFDVIKDKNIDMGSVFGTIHTIVVDHNIEYTEHGRFEGIDYYVATSNRLLCNKILDKMSRSEGGNDDRDSLNIKAAFVFDMMARERWEFRSLDVLNNIGDQALRDRVHKLLPLLDEYVNKRTALDNYEMTQKICDILHVYQGDGMTRRAQIEAKKLMKHDHKIAAEDDKKEKTFRYSSHL